MKLGLLWFDDSPERDLPAKIAPAIRRYCEKYGAAPDTCCVHVSVIDDEQQVGGVRVIPLPTVLRYHFWIGREEHPAVDVQAAAKTLRSLTARVATARRAAEPVTVERARQMVLALEVEQ